jgi:hypothetical protein
MASLREKVEAELEQMDQALRELPGARRVGQLSVLELGGTASLLSSLYAGDKGRYVQISGRAVTGKGPIAESGKETVDLPQEGLALGRRWHVRGCCLRARSDGHAGQVAG